MCVGLIRSVEGQNRAKGLTLPRIRGNSSCPIAFELGVGFFLFFLLFDSKGNISSSCISSLLAFRLRFTPSVLLVLGLQTQGRTCTIGSWVSNLLTADLGTCRLSTSRISEPVPYFLHTHTHTHTTGSVSLHDTNSVFSHGVSAGWEA